jgi:hypothetical protein
MKDEKDYRYDYRELDTLIGDLMYVCRHEADFAGELSDHSLTLRRLRDLFRKTLPKTAVS